MAQGRNRLLEVALFSDVHHNLVGATIVAQHGDMIIVKRAESKPRAKATAPRKPRTKKATPTVVPEVA
jgi:hypothetical protein